MKASTIANIAIAATVLALAGAALGQTAASTTVPSGLTYELLAPPGAEKLKSLPVVIYLRPNAAAKLDRAKSEYWPTLLQRKCLMVLPRGKSEKMWLAGEDQAVLNALAEVQTRYSVDDRRVILWGVSGGGQFALYMFSRYPEKFRAAIVFSTNPVVVRGDRFEWFYPPRSTLKTCPWFVADPITQGSALMCWRQVRAKLAPEGASISILPLLDQGDEPPAAPEELGAWLDEVLAGKFPAPLPDGQREAVKRLLAPTVEQMVARMDRPAAGGGEAVSAKGPKWRLSVRMPDGFERSKIEDRVDSTGAPLTQIRVESKTWPIFVRVEARSTDKAMSEVLSAEEKRTVLRGLLYQVYHTGELSSGGRKWTYKIGSITYPDRKRGWISSLFLHAVAPVTGDPKNWLTIMLTDETQQPDAAELIAAFKRALTSLAVAPAQAASAISP